MLMSCHLGQDQQKWDPDQGKLTMTPFEVDKRFDIEEMALGISVDMRYRKHPLGHSPRSES